MPPIDTPYISQLDLHAFRNYKQLRLELGSGPIVFSGHNGAGKTNILEAVSFLSPGRGLRSIKLSSADQANNHTPWAVSAHINTIHGQRHIGTGRDPQAKIGKRLIKIDGEKTSGQDALATVMGVIWITPHMGQIFNDSTSSRRKLLDRLVYNFDAEHAKRVSRYEQAMRERARLLQHPSYDPAWVSTLEQSMTEHSIAIAAARREAITHLQMAIHKSISPFPKAIIDVEGTTEDLLNDMPALQAEECLRELFATNRSYDAASGRTRYGAHRCDFVVQHMEKHVPAALCSTGEQKALLIAIILAEIRAKAEWKGSVPIVLMDDVIAHLDETRRQALFDEILAMNVQAWLTGTDKEMFKGLGNHSQFFNVCEGTLREKEAV